MNSILLITIAFNEPYWIREQARLLKKYVRDEFTWVVVDNSSREESSQQIAEFCNAAGVPYCRTRSSGDPSTSHGHALNWAYESTVKKAEQRFFGFLDHDVFPVAPVEFISSLLKCGIYGILQWRSERWYLWPGFSFFDMEIVQKVSNGTLNFLPCPGLDTGGSNWPLIYSKLKHEDVPKLEEQIEYIQNQGSGAIQRDAVCRFGSWIHVVNGSRWMNFPDELDRKFESVKEILARA